jgi:hypothetical protein
MPGREPARAMKNQSKGREEKVLLTLELPIDLVEWIDGIKSQLGVHSRGLVITELLRELQPDEDKTRT